MVKCGIDGFQSTAQVSIEAEAASASDTAIAPSTSSEQEKPAERITPPVLPLETPSVEMDDEPPVAPSDVPPGISENEPVDEDVRMDDDLPSVHGQEVGDTL